MDTKSRSYIDYFLSGEAASPSEQNHQPPFQYYTEEDLSDSHQQAPSPLLAVQQMNKNLFDSSGSDQMMDPAHMVNVMALQQRLVALMSEAQTVISQLQSYGVFPKPDAPATSAPSCDSSGTASALLASMYQGSCNQHPVSTDAGSIWGTPAPNPATQTDSESVTTLLAMANNTARGSKQPPMSRHDNREERNTGSSSPYRHQKGTSNGDMVDLHANMRDEPNRLSGESNGRSPTSDDHGAHILATGNATASGHGRATQGGMNSRSSKQTNKLAFVEFKRGRIRKYAYEEGDIVPGTYVLVDGDRGTDCGLLVQTIQYMPDGETSLICMDGCNVQDEKLKLENGRVLRPATNDDIDRLHNLIAKAEAVALKTCQQRCEELGIHIDLLDCEYQFDMKKVSFFFNCDHSVDFRELVRELYRTFGARIWMENVNHKVKNAMPEGGNGGYEVNKGRGGRSGARDHRRRN